MPPDDAFRTSTDRGGPARSGSPAVRGPLPAGAPEPPAGYAGKPLLAAKFVPPERPHAYVHRQRLTDRLASAATGPLTLITGPAGAGKTTLAASWARTGPLPGPLVWLTLDSCESAPGDFWAYVLEGFRRTLGTTPRETAGPPGADRGGHSRLLRLAALLERLPRPPVLVLDGFDRVRAREVAEDLEFLSEHAGPGLRLVLTSRVEPLLPLHRYRAEDRLAEIRAADLAFTPYETAVLLERHRLSPAPATVGLLTRRTEGWAAGLRLCALALQQSVDPDAVARSFAASPGAVADYLLNEVLDTQPAALRDLLLQLSVLDHVHPDLARALTGRPDAAELLDRLVRGNVFVTRLPGTPWCRLHPLFAQVLQAQLHHRRPGLAARLHHRAARWFAAADDADRAVGHAAAAGDWRYGADQAVRTLLPGRLLAAPGSEALYRLFSRMPADLPGAGPALVAGACALYRHDAAACRERLAAAAHQLGGDGSGPTPEAALVHALLTLVCAPLAPGQDDRGLRRRAGEAARQFDTLLERVPRPLVERHPELAALRCAGLAHVLLRTGELDAARRYFTRAAGPDDGPPDDRGTGRLRHAALGLLAVTESLRGELTAATGHATAAMALADRTGLPPHRRSGAGHLALAIAAHGHGAHQDAQRHLTRAEQCPDTRHDPTLRVECGLLRARLHLARGRREAARSALDDCGPAPSAWSARRLAAARSAAALARGDTAAALAAAPAAPDGTAPAAALARARAHLAAGHPDRALRHLAALDGAALSRPEQVDSLLVRAHAAVLTGVPDTARELLARALDTARSEQLRAPFTEAGPWLRTLLDGTGYRAGPATGHLWFGVRWGDGRSAAGTPYLVEPLSHRERQVLAGAARLLSADEIAAELCLSPNTVKTHLKAVYRKLGVSRRREAVDRGRELRLL
ncbi:helix-turn-helix transcriptional regulator [Streptomyces sp. CB02959]|uniref:LuxR C-terminal-related transcriptional regulator n=1 Tax=Streptomyces sp. CB02959 TaxID=2020330 RepID=UPI000C2782C4|nr:LuxR C-terminal-related transcriptional regulator [Streptomyces sp. CB02959]PJN39687.1 helix-turn-helix transcriptional regulator [Streptomyces sp. CB02959]